MRHLADFVNRMMVDSAASDVRTERRRSKGPAPDAERRERTGRAIGVLGIPGDRRDDDQKMYGALAAGAFDEIIVREDRNLRGREAGASAANVLAGVEAARAAGGARTGTPRRSSRRWRPSGPGWRRRRRATSS